MNMPGFTADVSLVKSTRIYCGSYVYSDLDYSQNVWSTSVQRSLSPALAYFGFEGGSPSQRVHEMLAHRNIAACYCASCVFGPQCYTYSSPSCDPEFMDWWCGTWIAIGCPDGYHPCMNYNLGQLRCCADAPVEGLDLTDSGINVDV
jgi:hypothetical protein